MDKFQHLPGRMSYLDPQSSPLLNCATYGTKYKSPFFLWYLLSQGCHGPAPLLDSARTGHPHFLIPLPVIYHVGLHAFIGFLTFFFFLYFSLGTSLRPLININRYMICVCMFGGEKHLCSSACHPRTLDSWVLVKPYISLFSLPSPCLQT